jgi:hypothetical protein
MAASQIYAATAIGLAAFTTADPTFNASADYVNFGLSGETLSARAADVNNTGGPTGSGYDVAATVNWILGLPSTTVAVVSLEEGTNDFACNAGNYPTGGPSVSGGGTWQRAIQDLVSFISAVRGGVGAHPTSFICWTVQDRDGAFFSPCTVTTYRAQLAPYAAAVNALKGGLCTTVMDVYADPHLGCVGCADNGSPYPGSNPAFQGDFVHPTLYTHETVWAPAWVPLVVAVGGGP